MRRATEILVATDSEEVAVAVAGDFGQLPGCEPQPYILRFTEDKRNPLYRRICYSFAWNAVISFALLNLSGLVIAVAGALAPAGAAARTRTAFALRAE